MLNCVNLNIECNIHVYEETGTILSLFVDSELESVFYLSRFGNTVHTYTRAYVYLQNVSKYVYLLDVY